MAEIRRGIVVAAGLALAVGLTGCGLMGELLGGRWPAVTADLSVFNRTEDDIFLVAADGERFAVQACGHARDASFRIDLVEVRTDAGYIRAFGVGDSSMDGLQLHIIEIAQSDESGMPEEGAVAPLLPRCEGHPAVQPGV